MSVNKFQFVKISWTSLPLIMASTTLLIVAWFVPLHRDPGGQGDILLSMMLMVRALAMRPSRWATVIGCALAAFALIGNAGLIPTGNWRVFITVAAAVLCIAFLFWERLASWWFRAINRG
jgi:hypothetical protein